jgi:hypothetical protein
MTFPQVVEPGIGYDAPGYRLWLEALEKSTSEFVARQPAKSFRIRTTQTAEVTEKQSAEVTGIQSLTVDAQTDANGNLATPPSYLTVGWVRAVVSSLLDVLFTVSTFVSFLVLYHLFGSPLVSFFEIFWNLLRKLQIEAYLISLPISEALWPVAFSCFVFVASFQGLLMGLWGATLGKILAGIHWSQSTFAQKTLHFGLETLGGFGVLPLLFLLVPGLNARVRRSWRTAEKAKILSV